MTRQMAVNEQLKEPNPGFRAGGPSLLTRNEENLQ